MRRLVLGIAIAVTSLVPVLGMADDQQIADYIKSRLQAEQSQGNLRGFNVDMRVEQGTVWFKGHVSNQTQEMTILRAAQQAGHLGVVQVVDDIEVTGMSAPTNPIQNAGYQRQQAQPMPMPSPYQQVSSQEYVGPAGGAMEGVISGGEPLPFASQGGSMQGPSAMPVSYATGGGAGGGAGAGAPNLPGYSWPGYAAHPNYGAVSYPKQYSASAWPYIGPFYPYPQVPLGWRKVSLEWDDGWWMLDFHDK